MSNSFHYVCVIMLQWYVVNGISYKLNNELVYCNDTHKIYPTNDDCFAANNVDTCAQLMNCYPNVKYVTFNDESYCRCNGYIHNGCYYSEYLFGNITHVYDITSFDKCNETGSVYFGKWNWLWFGILSPVAMIMEACAVIFFTIYISKQYRYIKLRKIGIKTKAVFSDFESAIGKHICISLCFAFEVLINILFIVATPEGAQMNYQCSIYYEANSMDKGLCSVELSKLHIERDNYKKLTSQDAHKRTDAIIVYNPNDITEWVFETDFEKIGRTRYCNKKRISILSSIYIIVVFGLVGIYIFARNKNSVLSLMLLLIALFGWPLICWFVTIFVICIERKPQYIIKSINDNKAPALKIGISNENM